MNTSKYNAGRLVMTEEAYFSSLSQKEAFQELGVEIYSEKENTDILKSEEAKLALISFDEEIAIVAAIDDAVEHHILLEKTNQGKRYR